MRAARLVARRSGTRRSLLLSLFAVVGIASFLLVGMVAYLAGTADAAVRETVTGGPATTQSVQLSTRLADDSQRQADAVAQLIDDAFSTTDATVHRSVHSNPAAARLDDSPADLILMSDTELSEHAKLVTGEWPSASAQGNPAAVHATAANELGLVVGDRFTVEGMPFEVQATWLPHDITEPYWFADPAVASGFDQLSLGPVVIPESELASLPVRSYAQWTITPEPSALTAGGLPVLADALDDLAVGVERASDDQSIQLRGTLANSVETAQQGLAVSGALALIPMTLVAVIGAITLAQLARLLVSVRRSETALLRARGASATQLTVVSLIEAVIAIAPGSALGAAAALGVLAGVLPVGVGPMASAAWPMALAVVVVGTVVCGTVSWMAASWRAVSGGAMFGRARQGRARGSVTIGVTGLVLAAAALALWQLKLYGSPLVPDQDGTLRVDPLAVAAPALMLLALGLLGLLAFGPASRLLERGAARARGILPALPARQLARRAPVFGVALLLLALAVSGTTLTALYSQTWAATSNAAAQLGNGADARIRLSPPPTVTGPESLVTTVPYLRLPGTTDTATVLRTPVRIADDSVGLTAISAARMPGVVNPVAGSVDPDRLTSVLSAERTGVPLDGDEIRVTVEAEGSPVGDAEVSAWVEDADGSLALVSLGSVAIAEPEPVTVEAALPEAREGWTLLALEATLSAADGASGVEVTVSALGEQHPLILSSVEPTERALTYAPPTELPVVVTESLATRLSLEAGSTVDARIPSTASTLAAVVAGTTPAIPAAAEPHGMLVDLPTLNRYLLATSERVPQPGEVWAGTEPGTDLVVPALAVSTTSASVTMAGDGGTRLLQPAIVALWWGSAGALLLAALAVLAITSAFTQDRRGEVIVLRALGLSSSEQGRNRLLELLWVAGAAVVTGIVTGVVASVLTVPELTAGGADAAAQVVLRFDVLGWSALVVALLVALVTILIGYARKVALQGRDAARREEAR